MSQTLRSHILLAAMALLLVAIAGPAQDYSSYKSREGIIKSSAPREAAEEFGRKIDRNAGLFDAI